MATGMSVAYTEYAESQRRYALAKTLLAAIRSLAREGPLSTADDRAFTLWAMWPSDETLSEFCARVNT